MAFNWVNDPNEIKNMMFAEPEKGQWNYQYARKVNQPSSIGHPGVTYADPGAWSIRRSWEGPVDPNADTTTRSMQALTPMLHLGQSVTMPKNWDPSANQFPWRTRQNITSDAERQQAFQTGLGGVRTTSMTPKFAETFDPRTDFDKAPITGYFAARPKYNKYNRSTYLGS